jgi:ArsR family transcriptional regulator
MSRNDSIPNSGRPANLKAVTRWLKVIAEPKRLQILDLLMQGVQCNCELSDALGMVPNLISHHLKVLREAGLVNVERDPLDARWMYYSVNQEKVIELRELVSAFLDPQRIQPRLPTCGPQYADQEIARVASR